VPDPPAKQSVGASADPLLVLPPPPLLPLPPPPSAPPPGTPPLRSAWPVDDNDVVDAVAPEEHKFIILPSLAVGGDNALPRSVPKQQQQQPRPEELVALPCNGNIVITMPKLCHKRNLSTRQ